MGVSGEAAGVGVVGSEGGRAGGIDGLNVNNDVRPATVEVGEDNVRLLRQGRTKLTHPLSHSVLATGTAALTNDPAGAEGSGEDIGEGVTHGVMDGGVEAHAVRALDEVTAVGGVRGSTASASTRLTGRGSLQLRGEDEEVEGKGGGVIVGGMEAEAGGNGHTLEPRGGALGDRAVEEAAAALGGSGRGEQGEEVSRGEGGSGGLCGSW